MKKFDIFSLLRAIPARCFLFLFLFSLLMIYSTSSAQIWEDFTVWYDGNGAESGHISADYYKSGSNDVLLKENKASDDGADEPFLRNGCVFQGWSLIPDGNQAIAPVLEGGSTWDPVDVPVTWIDDKQGFVFYARWECEPGISPAPSAAVAENEEPLLIQPDRYAATPTPTQLIPQATPTPALLIYPGTRSQTVGKEFENETDEALLIYPPDGETIEEKQASVPAPKLPVLFTPSNGELAVLPETGITLKNGFSRDSKPASLEYKPVRMELQLPSLDVSGEIVSVEHDENGYPIQWLEMNVGLLADADMPGEGFSVLAAHNTLDADTFGPFALIKAFRPGDRIFIRTDDNSLMIFEVYSNEKINEYDFEALYQQGSIYDNTVTLLTCEDERPEGGYINRRIVSARKIN